MRLIIARGMRPGAFAHTAQLFQNALLLALDARRRLPVELLHAACRCTRRLPRGQYARGLGLDRKSVV